MTEHQDLVDELAEKCLIGRVTFLVGAGIDMGRESNVPGWDAIRSEILQIVGREETKKNIEYIESYKGHLLNEVILQFVGSCLSREDGFDEATEVVRLCVETEKYSQVHRFLAWSIQELGNGVLTTNYNYLINHAAYDRDPRDSSDAIPKNLLVRLHGEIGDPASMRHKVDSVYAPLDAEISSNAAPLLKNDVLVVLGYRGADEFDVIPLIFGDDCKAQIVWTVHPSAAGSEPDDLVLKRLTRKPTIVDADILLEEVYQRVLKLGGPNDAVLDGDWSSATDGDPRWWKAGLVRWGDNMWSTRTNEMRFLWANLAEHVRAPFVTDAYERFLAAPSDTYRMLFARAHIAYDLRTKGLFHPTKFQSLLSQLRTATVSGPEDTNESLRNEFEELLAWTLHEYGVGLQNAKHYYEAKLILEKATCQRLMLGDPAASYSLFQLFMNGFQAALNGLSLEDFAPAGWQQWLPDELQRYEGIFRTANSTEHHPNTVHNRAFLHQAMAINLESEKKMVEAEREYSNAKELNLEAYNVRNRLRDPRRIAQSQVRIAQCALGMARAARANSDDIVAESLINEAAELIKLTTDIYRVVPQEDVRTKDVKEVVWEIARLRSEF